MRLLCAERFLQIHNYQQIIESARFEAQGEHDRVFHPWHDWYYRGIIATPYATCQELAPAGITPARVREVAATLHPKLPPEERRKKYTAIGEQLIRDLDPDFLPRIRSKLQRWRLPAYPWLLAERAYRILQAAFALTPPRVAQAYFSLLWNGWTTGRRFQRRERCVICGGDSKEDSLEHCFCPVMRRVATEVLSLQDIDPENPRPKHFLQSRMLLDGTSSTQTVVTGLLYIHNMYTVPPIFISVISFRNRGNGEKLISESGVSGSRADGNNLFRKRPIFLPSWGEASWVSEGSLEKNPIEDPRIKYPCGQNPFLLTET